MGKFKKLSHKNSYVRTRYQSFGIQYWSALLLTACGGGSTNSSSSGKVIDGYIQGARVFRDLNKNYKFDDDSLSMLPGAIISIALVVYCNLV